MLLSPPNPVSPLITEITVMKEADTLYLRFPEKHDAFRKVVKERDFEWSYRSEAWWRKVDKVTGPVMDRAAETAHVLLAAGFHVEVNDEVAQMVIDASYEPEKRKRISVISSESYKGWYAFIWPRDEDYYDRARRIAGSRYARPYVVLPPDHYEAVLDFAEQYNFYITPAAQRAIDKAVERKRAALIIDAPLKMGEQPARPKFDMEAGIDPELVDDDEPL